MPYRVDRRGIAMLSNNSLGLDLYALLAYRLPRLTKPLRLTWEQLQGQLGSNEGEMKELARRVREVLPMVRRAYPNAKVEAEFPAWAITWRTDPQPFTACRAENLRARYTVDLGLKAVCGHSARIAFSQLDGRWCVARLSTLRWQSSPKPASTPTNRDFSCIRLRPRSPRQRPNGSHHLTGFYWRACRRGLY